MESSLKNFSISIHSLKKIEEIEKRLDDIEEKIDELLAHMRFGL